RTWFCSLGVSRPYQGPLTSYTAVLPCPPPHRWGRLRHIDKATIRVIKESSQWDGGPVMTYARTYFRDTIQLNNAFKSRLRLEGLPPGDVLIAAREVTVDGAFDIQGRNLV